MLIFISAFLTGVASGLRALLGVTAVVGPSTSVSCLWTTLTLLSWVIR